MGSSSNSISSGGNSSSSNNSNVGYKYEWLEEEFLARWLSKEGVVEAVLGDPHPTGTKEVDGSDSAVPDSGGDQVEKSCRSW